MRLELPLPLPCFHLPALAAQLPSRLPTTDSCLQLCCRHVLRAPVLFAAHRLAAALLATYLWYVIAVNVGGGSNRFDIDAGVVTISRRGFRKPVLVEIPLKDVKAVKVEVRDGFNARRRVALRIQGRRDMPLTRVGEPLPLAQLEKDGAELARFLGVNLEGL